MKKKSRLITFIIVFMSLILLTLISYFVYALINDSSDDEFTTEVDNSITNDQRESISNEDSNNNQKEEKIDYHVAANVVWWDQSSAYNIIAENPDLFTSVIPFWYSLNEHGTIKKTTNCENQDLIDLCKENNILIVPTISNGQTASITSSIFSDQAKQENTISNIMNLIDTFGYDGIQLDFESMNPEDKDSFSTFVQSLSLRMSQENKILITTLHAKTSENGIWDGTKSQDWEAIGQYSDFVNIMAYDHHWSTSESGEIAPISWIRDVLDYANTVMNLEKILLGVHFYGYDWVGEKASALEYTDVLDLISTYNVTPEMTFEKEKYFTYEKDGYDHFVYYSDHETLEERLNIVTDYEIAGIAIWRLGHEDQENFITINDILNK